MQHILVSACLTGKNCKYNGGNNYNQELLDLMERMKGRAEFHLICPEQMGGLPIPHPASEIQPADGSVLGKDGSDVTEEFLIGAERSLETAKKYGCTLAVLKERSPSCGSSGIYDGTFSGTVVPGMGKAAALLAEHGVKLFGESQINELEAELMEKSRIEKQFDFFREIDKEKFIGRQTYLTDGKRMENDAEHAWHMAIMTILLSEYANEKIDVLKTVTMLLIHDIVEIDAGDTYAYDENAKKTQRERELAAADRIFNLLPEDQAKKMRGLWDEFEEGETPEARFAHTLDNIQPTMLNAATGGRGWSERGVHLSQVLKRNTHTGDGSKTLWDYTFQNFIRPHVEKGCLVDDTK